MVEKRVGFDDLLEKHPEFEGVIHKDSWEYISHSDEGTVKFLKGLWSKNIEENVKLRNWRRKRALHRIEGCGVDKATITVGAGQSFNKNKHILKQIYDNQKDLSFEEKPFIIIASNHQFKPLLDMDIVPDYVMLADASDVVYPQLCQDVPINGQDTILISGLQCSPKVVKQWLRQKREVLFYLPRTKGLDSIFHKITKKNPNKYTILQGGNVLNSAWSVSLKFLATGTFIALGNDLSFPIQDSIEEQRTSYYADGDYSSNAPGTGTGRDEARTDKIWGGFNIYKKGIYNKDLYKTYDISLKEVGTTHTLWVYKTWLEANVFANEKQGIDYHYFNCSEGGISGVMAREHNQEAFEDKDNWFLLDEECSKWHTALLEDAVDVFLRSRRLYGQKKRKSFQVS